MLQQKNQVPDRMLNQRAERQLSSRGLRAPCHIAVQTSNGMITLSGSVEHAHQKQAALQAARGVQGARGVIDQLQVAPVRKSW